MIMRKASSALPLIVGVIASVVVLAHAALLPGGAWKGDEFFNFALYQQKGLHFFWDRLIGWSPRPISEITLFAYYLAVHFSGAQLIWPFLLCAWLYLLFSLAAGWYREGDGTWGLALPICLNALFLSYGPIDEMFYWPMGAAPYLGSLSCVAFVVLWIIRDQGANQPVGVPPVVCLTVCAMQAEVGLMFVLLIAPMLEGVMYFGEAWA